MQGMEFGIKALVAAGAEEVGTYQGLPTFKVARTEDGSLADPAAFAAYLHQMQAFGKACLSYTMSKCTGSLGSKPDIPHRH